MSKKSVPCISIPGRMWSDDPEIKGFVTNLKVLLSDAQRAELVAAAEAAGMGKAHAKFARRLLMHAIRTGLILPPQS